MSYIEKYTNTEVHAFKAYTFKTFGPKPDGTYRYKVYNGPMVLRQGLCRNRKEAEVVARHYIASGQAEMEAFKFSER